MAAYAAVVSLKKTIERILYSSRISLVPPSTQIIRLAYNELEPLQEILKRLDSSNKSKSRKKVNALDRRIKDALWKFEDSLESHLSDQILSQFESCGSESDLLLFSIDLQGLQHTVDSFIEVVKDMEEEYIYELHNMPEEEDDESISSRFDFGGMKSNMVGLSDEFTEAKDQLIRMSTPHRRSAYSLVGMAGIGKTTLAKELFEDPEILSHFECRVWFTVGRKSHFNEIDGRGILAQLDPNTYGMLREGDDEVAEYLKKRLEGKKCLIVLDDVWDWDREVLDYLTSSLPEESNGTIQILLTTRERKVAAYINSIGINSRLKVMRLLNEEESKDLLREKVFGEDIFPPQLEKAGKKISKNCEGLPLVIVAVAGYLAKANKTPEYWNEVAEKRNSVFMDAYNDISKVLFPSYDYLPQYLKMFFLYIGVFPPDYEIPKSKLISVLTAEWWFLEPKKTQTSNEFVVRCLNELGMWSNLVILNPKSKHWYMKICGSIKTCRLHSSWRQLCKGEACKNKFFHVINCPFDGLEEGIKGQRCLCLYTNFSFGIKQVYDSVKSNCASTARSLLCFGPYHQFPVPIEAGFKLLRVLDALRLRFYNFPIEILKLVQLRYLALTYNGTLPASISKLFNLQFLIIRPHMSIKFCGAPSTVPVQIWDMQELNHIEILGSCLPNPNCAASLEKLSALFGVSASSCTREVLDRIPNIRKLGILIELAPYDDDSNPLSCLDHISERKNLRTLKCSIVNPEVKRGLVAPQAPLPMFPLGLKKLYLSGLGYLWKQMNAIGLLPHLEVLKLRCYAFQGPEWRIKRNRFLRLRYLLIEDTDLVKWKPSPGSFPELSYLSLKHCYKLEELHWPSDSHAGMIELVDSNPLAVTCAKQLKPTNVYKKLEVIASFGDGELK